MATGHGSGSAGGPALAAGSPSLVPIAARNDTRGTVICSHVEIGASVWARFMGLMGRPSLDSGAGLWLPGDNGIHMFFMRFPIDALFLSAPEPGSPARRVVSVYRGLRPWTGIVPFVKGAHGVLELPVGAIDASTTEIGDVVRIV
ncbi:MAG TPA: DUF192 domain-containing protein [Candidatus Limnocylindrales bacterium]